MHTREDFDEWFRDTPGVNQAFEYTVVAYWDAGKKILRLQQ
jgi:hypothetical protein